MHIPPYTYCELLEVHWDLHAMLIYQFIWSDDRVDHIAGHGVTAKEVEQVCFGDALVLRTKPQGRSPVY